MKRTYAYVLFKMIIALVSSLIVGLIVFIEGFIQYMGTWYDPLIGPIWMLALITQFYAIPAYILGGVPCSILIDSVIYGLKLRSNLSKYLMSVILYVVSGIFLILLFRHATQSGTVVNVKPTPIADALRLAFDGGVPALLFYHVSLLLRWGKTRINR